MAKIFQEIKNFYLRIMNFTTFCSGFQFLVILFIYNIYGETPETSF